MKRINSRPILLYIFSFLVPLIIILTALAGLKVTPFGDETLAISDGNGLYLNYLGYVSRAIKGQEGILFSFEKGLGGNMMGSWGWFLLNPIFMLFSLFDTANYMQAFTYVSVLNFCVCGLTMYILLKNIYGHKVDNIIFSSAYAMNGFLVANVFQMNFFVCIPVLPLVVLGLRNIIKGENPLIYILSLAYSLLMNFYFGFMLCMASFLYFSVFYLINRHQIKNKKNVVKKYIVSSLLAGAASSFIWIPALLSLRGGRLDQYIADAITMRENMSFLDMFSKLFTGANTTAELSNGLPNIFVGILPLFLLVLFFMNDKIHKRTKTVAATLLGLYLLSFYIAVFNIVMHGGTVTNWFNYRDSFVFCFIMLMVAAEEWQHLQGETMEHIKKAIVVLIVFILIVFFKQYEFVTGTAVLIDLFILSLMILAFQMYRRDAEKNPWKVFVLVVLVLMSVNLFLNYYLSTKNILKWNEKESAYQEVVAPVSALVEGVHNMDSDFYRMEVGEQRSGILGNDPMLYGYYGVGHGGSDDRDFVRSALSKLGIRRYDMRNSYTKGIPAATDTLLGLKYIISKEDLVEEKNYERLITLEQWSLYKNPYTLPVSFVANKEINSVELEYTDIFDNLNSTWSALSGNQEKLFLEENDVIFESHNYFDSEKISAGDASVIVRDFDMKNEKKSSDKGLRAGENSSSEVDKQESGSTGLNSINFEYMNDGSLKEPMENSSYIRYEIHVHRDGPVYSYNRSGMMDDKGSILPVMIFEGYYHEGDTIVRYLPLPGSNVVSQYVLEDVAGRFRVAYADLDALSKMSSTIQSRPSHVEKLTDARLCGTFTLKKDQELLFTIPYDEGWELTVDGKKTELMQVLGVFMAAEIEPGEHSFEMRFIPSGLHVGELISAVASILIIFFIIFDCINRKKLVHLQL